MLIAHTVKNPPRLRRRSPFSRYVVMSQAPSVSPNSGLAWRVAVLDGLPHLAKDTFIF